MFRASAQQPADEQARRKIDSLSMRVQQDASQEDLFERAWAWIDLEDWQAARHDFETARRIKGKKADTDLAAGIAYTHYRTGRYGLARQWCDTALAQYASNAFAMLYRGWSNFHDKSLRAAENDFTQYTRLRPAEPHGWYARQEVRRVVGDYVNALADIERALKIEPYNSLYLERKATLLNLLGRKDDAAALIGELKSQLNGGGAGQLLELARLHLRVGESGAALSYAEQALRHYADSLQRNRQFESLRQKELYEAYLLRGQIHESRGEPMSALRDYQRAVRVYDQGHEAWGRLGDMESLHRQNYHAAAEAYRNCFRLQPRYPVGWVNWGYSLSAVNNRQKALEVYRRALDLDSVESRGLLLNNYGFTCLELGYAGLSRNVLEQAVAEYPDLPMAHVSLGEYFIEVKDYSRAADCFLHALSLPNPSRREKQVAHLKLGVALSRQRNWEDAVEQFNEALSYDADHAETLYEKGQTLFHRGQFCEAARLFVLARQADELQGEGRSREISRWLRQARLKAGKSCL